MFHSEAFEVNGEKAGPRGDRCNARDPVFPFMLRLVRRRSVTRRVSSFRWLALVFYDRGAVMAEKDDYFFSKEKLPAPFSYPLKRSLLDAALDKASVKSTVYSVRYLFGRGKGPSTLDVRFEPEGKGCHASVSGRNLITLWSVSGHMRKQVEDVLVDQGLPLLCQWLARGSAAGNAWRSTEHGLRLTVQDGLLGHDES